MSGRASWRGPGPSLHARCRTTTNKTLRRRRVCAPLHAFVNTRTHSRTFGIHGMGSKPFCSGDKGTASLGERCGACNVLPNQARGSALQAARTDACPRMDASANDRTVPILQHSVRSVTRDARRLTSTAQVSGTRCSCSWANALLPTCWARRGKTGQVSNNVVRSRPGAPSRRQAGREAGRQWLRRRAI